MPKTIEQIREQEASRNAQCLFEYLNSGDPFLIGFAWSNIHIIQEQYVAGTGHGSAGEALTRLQALGADVDLVPSAEHDDRVLIGGPDWDQDPKLVELYNTIVEVKE